MGNLLQLFIRNGGFVTFVLVEVFCFYIVVRYNADQNAIFANTSSIIGGNLMERRQVVRDYFGLTRRVDSLTRENAMLMEDLANARVLQMPYRDTFYRVLYDTISKVDSVRHRSVRPEYRFIAARVISNSISSVNNWIMLNRGSSDGVTPNMAVVSGKGIVGVVRHVSPHFCFAMSVLHRQTRLSAALPKHENTFGTLLWEGGDPDVMVLRQIPKYKTVQIGEPVLTSGISAMFPKGITVGTVCTTPEQDPEYPSFIQMKVKLNQELATIGDVYIVQNLFKSEIDSLKLKIKDEQ
jgi:rod shape-determining protein MreC